jgi:hypothetical protein
MIFRYSETEYKTAAPFFYSIDRDELLALLVLARSTCGKVTLTAAQPGTFWIESFSLLRWSDWFDGENDAFSYTATETK